MDRLEGSVRAVLRTAGVPDAAALSAVVEVWESCVGAAVARHAWPLRLGRDGVLRVACTSSTWAFELGRMSPEIVAALRARLGAAAPAALRFAPGPVPAPGAAAADTAPAREAPTPEDRAEAARLTSGISDPGLRELAARALAASLAARRDGRAF